MSKKEPLEELIRKHGKKEVSKAVIASEKRINELTAEEQREMAALLQIRRQQISPEDKLKMNLLRLRLQIEEYLDSASYDRKRSFGFFLKTYIAYLEKRNNEFASEINIKPTVLSQYVTDARIPPVTIFVRLELHSKNLIPAVDWYRLAEKEKLYELGKDKELRREQRKFITKVAQFR